MEEKTKNTLLNYAAGFCFGVAVGIQAYSNNLLGSDDVTQPLAFSCVDPQDDAWIVRYYWLASAIQSQGDASSWELTTIEADDTPAMRMYYRQPEHVVCSVYRMAPAANSPYIVKGSKA